MRARNRLGCISVTPLDPNGFSESAFLALGSGLGVIILPHGYGIRSD